MLDDPVQMEAAADPDFVPSTSSEPHLISQAELNDLVRDLGLSKSQAELLGSRLQGWNLLSSPTKISVFHSRHEDLTKYFSQVGSLTFCSNINGLFCALGCDHDPTEWRQCINSSVLRLKVVLLHNGNIYPSIHVGLRNSCERNI